MLDKMAMKKAAMDMLSKMKELDMSKVSSVTVTFSDMSDKDHEEDYGEEEDTGEYEAEGKSCEYCECDAKRRGKGACCDRCGVGKCPDCGSLMEDNKCEVCEYEDMEDKDLQRMKHKFGIPHMLKMKELMDKGMSPLQAHKKVKGKEKPMMMKKMKEVEDEYEEE